MSEKIYNINIFNEPQNVYNEYYINIFEIYDFDIILSNRFNNCYYKCFFL